MSEAKHTPGPWKAHHDHGWLVVESDTGDLYVKVEKGSAARKHMADALLIAAAPDLLEALQAFVNHGTCFDEDDMRKARAAIARAIGKGE